MPSCSAARQSSAASPTGSAAAARRSRRVAARKLLDAPQEALLDTARERHRCPAARSHRRARPGSILEGAPTARAGCRASRRRSGREPARQAVRGPPTPAEPAHPRRGGPEDQLRKPGQLRLAAGSRTAKTSPTDSAFRRRATNATVCAEARSSHCMSSTTHTSGCSSATSDSSPSAARPRASAQAVTGTQAKRHAERVALRIGKAFERSRNGAQS